MEVLAAPDRTAYLTAQIERSNRKFAYCKVSARNVAAYRALLAHVASEEGRPLSIRTICCLGTRNGREVDLFRILFFGPALLQWVVRACERETHSFISLAPWLEALGRSDWRQVPEGSAVGVEINPRAARRDVWTGSFDQMPADWTGRFDLLYSNSFDQSQDPVRTAREWRRITRPGGHLIVCFSKHQRPTATDPVGGLRVTDLLELFDGALIYYSDRGLGTGYSEAILRMPEASQGTVT